MAWSCQPDPTNWLATSILGDTLAKVCLQMKYVFFKCWIANHLTMVSFRTHFLKSTWNNSCLDEAAEMALVPSFKGCISDVQIPGIKLPSLTLSQICWQFPSSFSWVIDLFSVHCTYNLCIFLPLSCLTSFPLLPLFFAEAILNHVGIFGHPDHSSFDHAKLSYHCQQFGCHAR